MGSRWLRDYDGIPFMETKCSSVSSNLKLMAFSVLGGIDSSIYKSSMRRSFQEKHINYHIPLFRVVASCWPAFPAIVSAVTYITDDIHMLNTLPWAYPDFDEIPQCLY